LDHYAADLLIMEIEPIMSMLDRPDDDLPARVDVVVIGGGIIGISTALHLAQRGLSTIVCEKGKLGGEQSSRNWGWCRTIGRDVLELDLAIESVQWWRKNSIETGFKQTGIAYLCERADELDEHAGWFARAGDRLDGVRLLAAQDIESLFPLARGRWHGALYAPFDGCAEPALAVAAFAKAAEREGVRLFTQCAVRGIETVGGKVSAAVTEHGAVACDGIVLAGGAWSRLFCGNLGINLPQLKVLGSVLRTLPIGDGPAIAATTSRFAFRRHLDSSYSVSRLGSTVADIVPDSFRLLPNFFPALLAQRKNLSFRLGRKFLEEWKTPRRWTRDSPSPFEQMRTLDPAPVSAYLTAALKDLSEVFPGFSSAKIARCWGGMIDVTPDAIPVISQIPQLPGFWIATGFSGHGFGIAPAAGRLMADIVCGRSSKSENERFNYRRFFDSPLAVSA
jgi:glycine/D-amino acid oxidase-like deaminating enzyme